MNHKSVITFILATSLIALTSSCQRQKPVDTYKAALRYIPDSANPYSSQVDTDHFIMLQLYYPLFQRSEDGTLSSEFLDLSRTISEDSHFQHFILCLRSNSRFSDGSPILLSDLRQSLQEAHSRQELLPQVEAIKLKEGCVEISLKSSDPRYFEKLTGIASTITSQTASFGGFPIGLGPYHVISHSPERLTLAANPGRVQGTFKTIEYRKFRDVASDYADGVFDFNHTAQVKIPTNIEKNFQRVSRPFFKSYAIVVNYPDPSLRKLFSSCFASDEIRPLLDLSLKPIPGLLPSGLQGSESVTTLAEMKTNQNCARTSNLPITFFNYRPELRTALQSLLSRDANKLPIPIRYEEGSVTDLIQKMFHEDRMMAVIGFDSSTSNSSASAEAATFFESFIRTVRAERLVTTPVSGLAEVVRTAAQTNDSSVKAESYRKAHQMLLNSGYVIPLGQLDTDQLYPKTIRHIVWSDQISGFPAISLMETAQ